MPRFTTRLEGEVMAAGDYSAEAMAAMSGLTSDAAVAEYRRAQNALRVAPQLGPNDLQFCIAFGISPFALLAARLGSGEQIAADRADRARSEQFREREDRRRQGLPDGPQAAPSVSADRWLG